LLKKKETMTTEELYLKYNNFDREFGLELKIDAPGIVRYRLEITEKHLSSPGVGHGASVAAIMDAILGTTALSKVYDQGNLVSTVEFKLNYFKPIFKGDVLIATGNVDFEGKSLIVTTGSVIKEGTKELVSKGIGTFNIYPMSKRGLFI